MTSLAIPEGVLVGSSAFRGCTGLTNLVIPNNATFEDFVFSGCAGLTSLELPDGMTTINAGLFSSCTGLTSVVLPENVTTIEGSAFQGCTGLESVVIPDGVTTIGSYAFYECTGLTDVILPSGIKTVSNSIFQGCTGLTNVTIPTGVTSIGSSAFSGCTGLTNVTIPTGVTSIGEYAFRNCALLRGLLVPSSVTKIGYKPFSGVKSIIYCGDTTFDWGADIVYTTMPDEYGFIYADEEKTKVEYYAGTGGDVVIPDGVTEIGNYTFSDCQNVYSVFIPASVTSIGQYAFQNCTGLIAIYLNSLVPPTTYFYTFYGLDLSNCTLYVPEGFEDSYKNANYWKSFTNIAVNPYVTVEKKAVIYMVDGEEYHRDSVVVTTAITAIDAPTREGYTFSGWSEIPATMPDNDVTVTGTFTINRYAVIYMVDGVEFSRDSVEYGATITLAENPTRDGYIFSGWSGYPETLVMPAGDVVVTGAFEVNGLAGVAAATSGDEYFDLTGKPLPQPQRGINLVRCADGTTRKIIVR